MNETVKPQPLPERVGALNPPVIAASRLDRFGVMTLHFGLIMVLVWIGAESIVPFIANNPFLPFVPDVRDYPPDHNT